jgi:hypothetical protein
MQRRFAERASYCFSLSADTDQLAIVEHTATDMMHDVPCHSFFRAAVDGRLVVVLVSIDRFEASLISFKFCCLLSVARRGPSENLAAKARGLQHGNKWRGTLIYKE